MEYLAIRHLHITCAFVSLALFVLRAWLQWRGVHWRRWGALRVLPHVNDTVLLAAAVALAWMSGQTPWTQAWLALKVVALFAYIGFGARALRAPSGARLPSRWFWLALTSVAVILVAAHWRGSAVPNFFS